MLISDMCVAVFENLGMGQEIYDVFYIVKAREFNNILILIFGIFLAQKSACSTLTEVPH